MASPRAQVNPFSQGTPFDGSLLLHNLLRRKMEMATVIRSSPRAQHKLKRGWIAGVLGITLLIYALWTPRVLRYTQPPSGDQPYYLMTAISLLEDHDLNEYNNYHERASYDQFYPPFGGDYPPDFPGLLAPYPLPPEGHISKTRRPPHEWYSKHGLGVPLLILPGWALGKALTPLLAGLTLRGDGGWPGVVFELNLLGALLAVQVFLLAWEMTGKRWISLAVWAALAFSNPQMSYSFLIFPELPAALLILYAFRRLRLGWARNRLGQLALIGLCIGYLPWLHSRFLALVPGLMAYGLHQWRQAQRPCAPVGLPRSAWRTLGLFLMPVALSGGALATYYGWLYGLPLPNAHDHAGFFNPLLAKDRLALLLSTLGLFLDQQWGLFPYAPILMLAMVGGALMALSREGRRLGSWLGAIILPYLLLVAAYRAWWGEWCPPARYLAPVTPLATVPLTATLEASARRPGYKALYALLAGASIAIMIASLANLSYRTPERIPILFNLPTGEGSFFLWLESRTGVNLRPFIPALVPWFVEEDQPIPWRAIWVSLSLVAAIISTGLLALRARERAQRGQPRQSLAHKRRARLA